MLDAKVFDKRTTTRKIHTDVLTGEVKTQESHGDLREVTVIDGLPKVMEKTYGSYKGPFEPRYLKMTWRRTAWSDHKRWYFHGADLVGYRLKKDGTPGSQEVQQHFHITPEMAEVLKEETDMPDFVLELYKAYHPGTGKPYTYPVHQSTADDDLEGAE